MLYHGLGTSLTVFPVMESQTTTGWRTKREQQTAPVPVLNNTPILLQCKCLSQAEGQKECSKQPISTSSVSVYHRLKDRKSAANSVFTCSEQHSHSPPAVAGGPIHSSSPSCLSCSANRKYKQLDGILAHYLVSLLLMTSWRQTALRVQRYSFKTKQNLRSSKSDHFTKKVHVFLCSCC